MTRFYPVRDLPQGERQRHPDAPKAGFGTAQACLVWMDAHGLGWQWYIHPEEEEAS